MDHNSNLDPHRFSHANLSDFKKRSCTLRTRYILLLLYLGCSVMLLLAEIFVGVSLLLSKTWVEHVLQHSILQSSNSSLSSSSPSSSSPSSLTTASIERIGGVVGWIVLGSTGLNLLVVFWDWRIARSIVASDSISKAFLNITAFQLWSIKSYAHYCLLSEIKWGHNMRQRMMMAVYFGIQGFISALVTLPRLIIYGFILYAIRSIPGLGVTSIGFQWLQLEGFRSFNSSIMMCTLAIITLSSIVHSLDFVRVMFAGIICSCSVCCLGRIKRTIDRDLKHRIMTHVLSARRFQHETYSDKGSPRSQYELNLTGRTDQQSFYRQSEKGGERSLETIDLGHGSQAIFDEVDLGLEPSKLTSMNCKESAQTITIPSRFNCVSKVNAISPERNFSINSVTTSYTPGSQGIDVISPPVFEPKMNDIQSNAIASQTTYISTDVVTSGQQGLIPRGEDIVRRASDTVPRDRLATLSFYDDLLKSINSERMIYASSLSNHVDLDVQQSIVDSNNLGLESGPQVKMSPETFFGYSNYDNPDSCEKPIHPFDVIPHSHSSTTLKFRHIETANMDVSDHSIGAPRGESINQFPYRKSQQSFTNGFYFSSLSRSESSNSQETIENWRIHVEPSSPGIPEFDYDMQKATANANNKTTHGIAEADCDFEADGALDQYEDSVSRRGTIPIILSSHLLEAKLDCQESQDGLFSVNDLHLPRPSYAYSQTRTQRQGSVNSSIGGYNYSAASSPSLADSLSNPMYQQSYGMMNGFHGPRNVPPRKCSLPISILSSGNDDSITRTSPLQYQTSQLQIPQHPACPTFSTRTKTRSPSHLSNMLYQSDCDISTKGNVDRSNRSEYEKPPSIQKKTHFRSQSFGTRSSVRQSASSWDQPEYFRDPQVGYASQMHLPPSSASYVYQGQDRDSFLESSTKMNLSSKMSLKEALAIDSPRNDYSSSSDRKSLYMAGGYYEGQSDTQFVHPLDLSPLLQQSQLRNQHEHHHNAFTHTTMNYGADSNSLQPEAWPEVYIGLGLTFNNNSYGQQTESNRNEYPFTGATASKYSLNQHDFNSSNNNFRGNYWDNPESRPELPTRNPTMTTDLSGETLTNYRQAITTEVHNDYENEILRHHKQQLNTTLVNQHLPQVDHKELSVIHRQPSQRNKKNLVVNIVPQNCS